VRSNNHLGRRRLFFQGNSKVGGTRVCESRFCEIHRLFGWFLLFQARAFGPSRPVPRHCLFDCGMGDRRHPPCGHHPTNTLSRYCGVEERAQGAKTPRGPLEIGWLGGWVSGGWVRTPTRELSKRWETNHALSGFGLGQFFWVTKRKHCRSRGCTAAKKSSYTAVV
jgi:hypothetical protein